MLIDITEKSGIPLMGAIPFGIIDRGTNILQVRATSICNLGCLFCSTGGGVNSGRTNYVVELNYLLKWLKEVTKFKEDDEIEVHLDSVGEVMTYKNIAKLITEIKKIKEVKIISMQSNGTLLNTENINKLEKAGLNRINLSLHSLNNELAKRLSGVSWYNTEKIVETTKLIQKSKIELWITPVWVPGMNDEDMVELIKFAKEIDAPIGIQKYEKHKYGLNPKKVKQMSWYHFYQKLDKWEKEFGYKLKYGRNDMNIKKVKILPKPFRKGDKIKAEIICSGWMPGQKIAKAKNRCITINNCDKNPRTMVTTRILEDKNNLFIGEVK